MEENNIKDIWKKSNAKDMNTLKYSVEDIRRYRVKKSNTATKAGRLSILFDIGYKMVVFFMLIFLMTSIAYQPPFQTIISVMMAITGGLVLINIRFLNTLSSISETGTVIDNLKRKLQYYLSTHKWFILSSAMTNPLFVLSGFFIYYHLKYNEIRLESPLEDIIPYLFILASFVISYFAQLPVYKSTVRELKESIYDLDDSSMAMIKFEESKLRKRNVLIVFGILLLVGILLFLIIAI